MKGLVIHQLTNKFNNPEDIDQFALIKASEIGKGGGFSRIKTVENDAAWNSTIINISNRTTRNKKPFHMELK